jgi:hypothetical protein
MDRPFYLSSWKNGRKHPTTIPYHQSKRWNDQFSLVVEPASMKAARKTIVEATETLVEAAEMGKMIDWPEVAYWSKMMELTAENKMMEMVMDVNEDRKASREAKWEVVKARIAVNAVEAHIVIGDIPGWRPVNGLVDVCPADRLLRDVPASIQLLTCFSI